MLGEFYLKGKIISEDNLPLKDLNILAYDYDLLLNPADFLGEASTDSNGLFEINFDKSKFSGFFEALEGTPDVFLMIKDSHGNELMRTKRMQTKKQIEYHIKVIKQHKADPNAKDIYAGNGQRMIAMLTEVGDMLGLENTINLDLLANKNLKEESRKRIEDFANRFEERRNNYNHFMIMLSTLVDSYFEELKIGTIGYDGPQVPRQPRRVPYDQVITWPREEEFKWA